MDAESRDALLEEALDLIDTASPASIFARRRWPLPLPSRRAALGGFGRLLNEMQAEEAGSSARFSEDGVRRRYLVVLLRQLRGAKGAPEAHAASQWAACALRLAPHSGCTEAQVDRLQREAARAA